ncbi:MAG TPA: hypothetical protein VFD92_17470 [Candidatus Binatia bacterium]|nr:hypothetical protein [Candidatus Binatia bacterium]
MTLGRRDKLIYLVAALPIVATVTLYSLVLLVYLRTGYWPYRLEPGQQLTDTVGDFATIVGLLLLPALTAISPLVFFIPVVASLFAPFRYLRGPAVMYLFSWSLWALFVWRDPGGIYDWLLD